MLGLILGGGAAKGYAHIGVIKFLEEEGIIPQLIVGSSMGALIGGFFAAGYNSQEMSKIACRINRRMKRWLFRPTISKYGIVSGKNIEKFLEEYLNDIKIEELSIKFAGVATDIENNQELIINKGSLLKAIRASISIPVILIPYIYGGYTLIDGGFVNPIPISVAKKLGAKKIIAVNVLPTIDYKSQLFKFYSRMTRNYNMKKIFERTFNLITARLIQEAKLQLREGVFIDVDTREIAMSEFEKARPAIEKGYLRAKQYHNEIKKLVQS